MFDEFLNYSIILLRNVGSFSDLPFVSSIHFRFINWAIIRILGDSIHLCGDSTTLPETLPAKLFDRSCKRSTHPDPRPSNFAGAGSSSSSPRDISARITAVYWDRYSRRHTVGGAFSLWSVVERRFFVYCFCRCFEK